MEDFNFEEYRFPERGGRANFHIEKWDGENNPHSFLTRETVKTMRELYEYRGKTKKYLQEVFKLSRQHLNAILNKKLWK